MGDWYGCDSYDLADELFVQIWGKARNGSINDRRQLLKNRPSRGINVGGVAKLRTEHINSKYLAAWKYWLLAPPSKSRNYMNERISSALIKIKNESVLPLIYLVMENGLNSVSKLDVKKVVVTYHANLISSIPCDNALNFLLRINRYAVSQNWSKDDYYNSVTRFIVRALTSRRAFADQLIDPKMKKLIQSKGYNETPIDVPLRGNLCVKYKSIVKAKLMAMNDQTPQADRELLIAIWNVMPENINYSNEKKGFYATSYVAPLEK